MCKRSYPESLNPRTKHYTAALIVFPLLYTLRIGITNNKSIDDFRLIFGKTMMKGVLARLERIFERVDAQEDISTDV